MRSPSPPRTPPPLLVLQPDDFPAPFMHRPEGCPNGLGGLPPSSPRPGHPLQCFAVPTSKRRRSSGKMLLRRTCVLDFRLSKGVWPGNPAVSTCEKRQQEEEKERRGQASCPRGVSMNPFVEPARRSPDVFSRGKRPVSRYEFGRSRKRGLW